MNKTGFKSQMSIVEGPPPIQRRIADLRRRFRSSALFSKVLPMAKAGMVMAEAPVMCDMKCRRDIPLGVDDLLIV